MPHIHTGEGEHDFTTSAFIVRTDFEEPKVMLHIHKNLRMLLQFGGHVELHEDPWQALTHELLEESGYEMDQLQVLQPRQRIKDLKGVNLHPIPVMINTHNVSDEHMHTDMTYALISSEEPKNKIEKNESNDIRLLTYRELDELSEDVIYGVTRKTALYIISHCLSEWEEVSTAEYLSNAR